MSECKDSVITLWILNTEMTYLNNLERFLPLDVFLIGVPFQVRQSSGSRGRYDPYGTQFFHFPIHFHRKEPMTEVHTP